MIRVAVSVEGETEEEFVKQILAVHLRTTGTELTPIRIGRALGRTGGGNVSVERLVPEMVHLHARYHAVTSLVDFYGFRGKGSRTVDQLEELVDREVRRALGRRWRPDSVIPYVQRHEFESLLFAEVEAFEDALGSREENARALREIRASFSTPEDINDNAATAPSKRILRIVPRYRKRVDGLRVAMAIGLATMRSECPRFGAWASRLESLGTRLAPREVR